MATFQAKIDWKMLRKRENKNCRSISFLPRAKQKIPKKQQKIQKIKKYQYGVFSSQNSQGKNSKKFKKLRNSVLAFFQAKIDWGRQRKRENKNCRFVPFRSFPTRNLKFQKNSNKIEKIKKYHYGLVSSQNRLEKAEKGRK